MNEDEVLKAIEEGHTVYGLVVEHAPHLIKKFDRLCKSMKNFIDEVHETFPDAEYYTSGGDGFDLLLGRSHDDHDTARQELVALCNVESFSVGGGDW